MPANPPVVMLVEPLARDRYGNQKARFFPFLLGYLSSLGVGCTWFTISYAARKPASDVLRVDLVAEAREWLEGEARALGATHLLSSESLDPALADVLATTVPHVRWFDAPGPLEDGHVGWLHVWLGLPGRPEQFLPEACAPRYASSPCPYPSKPEPPLIAVVMDPLCVYCAPLASNPCYAGLPPSAVENQRGCAFCDVPVGMTRASKRPPLETALEQLVVASRTPASLRNRSGFQLDSSLAARRLDKLVREMVNQQVTPTALYLTCRPDELLEHEQHIFEGIRCAAEAGHTVHLGSIGAESFSDEENQRFNKGLTATTVVAAIERARAWEAAFPATFFFERAGGMGFILYTPWTTLGDLEINVTTARRLALSHPRFLLTRRLMLLPDLPITALARHDGLTEGLSEEESDLFALLRRCDPGCRHWVSQQEIPWRFRDARVGAVVPILLRLAVVDLPAPDALQARLASRFRDDRGLLEHVQTLLSLARQQVQPDTASLARALLAASESLERSIRHALSVWASLAPGSFVLNEVVRDPESGVVQMTFLAGGDRMTVLAGPAGERKWPITRGRLGFACGDSNARDPVHGALLAWVARALAPRRAVR